MFGRALAVPALVTGFVIAIGCGDSDETHSGATGGDGASADASTSTGGASPGGTGGASTGGTTSGGAAGSAGVSAGRAPGGGGSIGVTGGAGGGVGSCSGQSYPAEARQLDMYIMLDRSGSMLIQFVIDLWTPITTAIGTFVTLPEAAGMGVGIQFFGIQDDSCDPNVYAQPAAGIAPLPDNATAIQQAIANNQPTFGETPTLPALQGAIQHARSWAQQSPDKKVIVVLATDGEPNKCNSTAETVSQVAADGLNGTPSIPTYVIGIGNIATLNLIAQAGGTGQALVVAADPQVASQQFLDAMNAIRGRAFSCEYQISAEGAARPDLVNLSFDSGAGATFVSYVASASACDPVTGGWYYDNPATPLRIVTCPATCNLFRVDVSAEVSIVLGCPTVVR